jgi:murein DD-endopeptidase MepM/ murein hydrolase activator NlpD
VDRDRRRLIQLAVSLALFVLVFAGRGVFPRQAEAWKQLTAEDTDFLGAIQRFGQAVSSGETARGALQTLYLAVLGQDVSSEQTDVAASTQVEVTLLSETDGHGLTFLDAHGLPTYQVAKAEPEPDPVSEAAEVVTAVAQAYTADGVALPSNVSFAYYELGLAETVAPVQGTVTSTFGYRDSPVNGVWEFHLAMDIGAEEGTPIGAFAAGTVEYIGESDEFGQYLKITHENGVSSFYAHCSKLLVSKGDVVTCGQTVALVGHTGNATGSHLHLTIEKDNIRLDPSYYVDPS